jgi:hypothetical protein
MTAASERYSNLECLRHEIHNFGGRSRLDLENHGLESLFYGLEHGKLQNRAVDRPSYDLEPSMESGSSGGVESLYMDLDCGSQIDSSSLVDSFDPYLEHSTFTEVSATSESNENVVKCEYHNIFSESGGRVEVCCDSQVPISFDETDKVPSEVGTFDNDTMEGMSSSLCTNHNPPYYSTTIFHS